MGFSVSGATAIVFLGAVIAFGSMYPAAVDSAEQVSTAQAEQSDRLLERQNTELSVLAGRYHAGNDTLTARVANNGTTALAVADVDVLVDGGYRENATVVAAGSADSALWLPGETVTVTVEGVTPASPGEPLRVKLVTGSGVADATEVAS
jgi:flagellar protein FlaF